MKRRDLVETDTESGTIGYANPQTVYNRLSGTITWLPEVGQVIKPGQTLFRIDGEPVTLMDGSAPAYRELDSSDTSGVDIEQLNRNLVRLGFDPDGIVIDDEWQPATTAGVELLQESLGEGETGSLSLGQVVFLPGDQVVSALDGTVGSTGGGSPAGSSSASAAASTPSDAGESEFVSLEHTTSGHATKPAAKPKTTSASGSCPHAASSATTSTTTTTSSTTTASSTTALCTTSTTRSTASKPQSPSTPKTSDDGGELSKLTALLKAEAAQLKAATAALKAAKKSSSSRSSKASSSSSSKSSDSGGSATAILQTSSTQLIVTVDLSASSQSEAKVGAAVTVELPSGETVDGTITAVSSVAETPSNSASSSAASSSGGSSASSTVPVTIKLKGHHRRGAGLDQASVSVNFAQAKAKHVLSVPVTALIATAGGGYAVQEANAPYRRLRVTTGLFAAGYVQISGHGIHSGLRVTNSQG